MFLTGLFLGSKPTTLSKDMLRKTNSQKGFTIIEVVITIAIGAAVMALVLNAVAGARRSQRNNARVADVSHLAGVVNQFIANRNALPAIAGDIKLMADNFERLGHYEEANINAIASWVAVTPVATGNFGWLVGYDTGPVDVAGILMHPARGNADFLAIVQKAKCNAATTLAADPITAGGIREMAIVYTLEGDTAFKCLQV